MLLPKKLSDYRSGRIRERKASSKQKSFRVFKNWTYATDGSRSEPKVVTHRLRRFNADLCSTYYENPARGTQTVHGLGFDIDLKRTQLKWIDEKGRVCWEKIGSFLAEYEDPILSFVTKVAASTSGKGLGLYLPIAPLEIVPSTAKAQQSARILQAHIITILNYHGIGADPGAMGLVRDIPNYFNPKKLIDSDLMGLDRFVDNKRYPVVAELLKYTNGHPAVGRLKSKDPKRLFSGHRTSEKKLAGFYEYLIDEALESSIWLSGPEISELTGLSKTTLYHFLSSQHEWLEIKNHGKAQGYELIFKPTAAYSERVYALLNGTDLDSDEKGLWTGFSELEAPELVLDGDRNDYLTRAVIELKHKAIPFAEALKVMKRMAWRIPGAESSRNCRYVEAIVKSIYYHRLDLFGIKAHEPLSLVLKGELDQNCRHSKQEFPKKSKKGTTVGSIHSGSSTVVTLSSDLLPVDKVLGLPRVEEKRQKPFVLTKGEAVRPGDLPPVTECASSSKPHEKPEFSLLLAFVPAAARNIAEGKSSPAFEASFQPDSAKNELQILPPDPEINLTKPKVFKTLKALRSANYMERDPLDRLDKALERCLKRKSESEILAAMVKVEPQIRLARRRGKIYEPEKGPYRRVIKAFSLLSDPMRLSLLRQDEGSLDRQ